MNTWTLLQGGTVLLGPNGSIEQDSAVLVKDQHITAVGRDVTIERVPRGEPVEIIDARHKTVMPGLIDAHCHLTYGESRTQEEQDLYTSVESRTLRAAWNVKKMLRAGVTSLSQPGGSYFIGVAIRDAIESGMLEGPRVFTAGRYITTSNGLADFYPTSVGVPEGSIGKVANTQDEMLAEVRTQVKNGVDLIKLADSPYGEYQAFMPDELKRMAELTHQLNRRITIHARGSAEVDAAVAAGFDWIMHGNVMTDEVIGRLAASKIPLVPTLLLLANFADWGHLVGVPIGSRDGSRRMLDKTADTLHRAHAAGVHFVTGSDTGFAVTPYGEWHARELELLMEYAGLDSLEAIRAATVDAACTVGLSGEVGELRPGMLADIIVIDGDPIANIRVLQEKEKIVTVIKGGRIIDFDPDQDLIRWPHDRAQIQSVGELTREVVWGADVHAAPFESRSPAAASESPLAPPKTSTERSHAD
jgi:imidazolonepropionase-like amidohydrolase